MNDPATLQRLWREFAAKKDAPALIAFSGDTADIWSFAHLAGVSGRIAATLLKEGIRRDDGVALVAPNSPRWIAAFWGVAAAGAITVPLDAQNDDRELARMLRVGGCRWAFTTAALAPRIHTLAPSAAIVLIDSDTALASWRPWREFLLTEPATLPFVAPTDIATIVFTSGTTGSPKAVPLTHANLLSNVLALEATKLVGVGDRALLPLPLYHAYPLTIGMITPLALGCAVVLPAGISGPELLAAMRDGAVTALVGVPRLYTALVESVRRGIATLPRPAAGLFAALLSFALRGERRGVHWPGRLLLSPLRRRIAPRLRLLVSGGAAVPTAIEETLDALGWEMLTGYGLVETASMLTFNPPGAAVHGAAGKPVPGMAIRIANADAGGVGDIETRGPSLFAGYRDDPAKTRDAFTADGWFKTGDLGRLDTQGFLHIVARRTETIVLADGKKLFPEEFESVYATAPLVREVALLGVDGALVGLVVPNLSAARESGAMRLADALRDGLADKGKALPSYARLSGFAVTHEALPRTQLGKIRRHLLPALYAAARRHEPEAGPENLSESDRALIEQPTIAAVWRWLQVKFPDRSLRLDTILQLDLGVDSLAWVELTLALERDLGIALREKEIARIVTIRDLLHEAGSAQPAEAETAAALRWLAPLGWGLRLLRFLGEPLIGCAIRWAFHLKVEGLERLPATGPMLFCPNHVSYLDPFAVGMAMPRAQLRRTYWGGWAGVAFNSVLRRLFSRAAQVIPVDPDRAAASGLALGRLALERGWNLVWFPEGARSADGKLQRFLPGIGALVETRDVPIIPVHIGGSFAAWPLGRKYPRRGAITVRFGGPLLPSTLAGGTTGRARDERIAAAVQAAVTALA